MRLNSQSESGKCRIKMHVGRGAPDKLGAPVLLQTLALYSYMTFENAKVAQIGKKNSNWNDSKRIFGTEIDENEMQNCKSLEQNT